MFYRQRLDAAMRRKESAAVEAVTLQELVI